MSNIKFVSHESFPDDPYIKELVYLSFDEEDSYRVAYVRKQAKTGGMFWSTVSISILKDGVKSYRQSFMQDSNFLEKDIKDFLDKRSWDNKQILKEESITQKFVEEEIPF